MPPQRVARPGLPGHGMPTLDVVVIEVDDARKVAYVRDNFGEQRQVPTRTMRVPITPAPGQRWVIDRTLGFWTFASFKGDPDNPTPDLAVLVADLTAQVQALTDRVTALENP